MAFVECMTLEEIAFQYRQWTIAGAPRSPVHAFTANNLLISHFSRGPLNLTSRWVDTRDSKMMVTCKTMKIASLPVVFG